MDTDPVVVSDVCLTTDSTDNHSDHEYYNPDRPDDHLNYLDAPDYQENPKIIPTILTII